MSSIAPAQRPLQFLARIARAQRGWRIVLGLLVLLVAFLAVTPVPPRELSTGWDKLNHALAFAALAFAGGLAFPASRRSLVAVCAAVMLFGGAIEIVQAFVPGRSCELEDLLADALGTVLGTCIAWPIARAVAAPR